MQKNKILALAALGIAILIGGTLWYVIGQDEHTHSEASSDHAGTTARIQKYTCGMHPFIIQDEPGNCPICGMKLTPVKPDTTGDGVKPTGERTIKYWVAPMDPTYIRKEPGKSPMGMDLVPVYEGEAMSGSVITIDPVTQQNMGVRTAHVSLRNLHRTIRTVGVVGYEESQQYSINTKTSGWIERLYVNETGAFVKKGQPLLEIYSPELVAAQEEFLLAFRNKKSLQDNIIPEIAAGADRLLESSRKRLQYWDISAKQIAELERSGKALKTLVLQAPYGGVITRKNANEGMLAQKGVELFTISDISSVWVYADIYEYELPWVKVGQTARIQLPYQHEPLSGKISTVYPYVETKTRTVKVRIDLKNPSFDLKPDMYVNVRIEAQSVMDVLAIPVEAVLNSGEKQTVFVALGEGKFEPRQVKLGIQGEEGYIQVIQGLLANESVVTSAQFMLDSESTLREAIQKMLEPKKDSPAGDKADESLNELFENNEIENLDDLFKN
jgi:Cu(I)/Ag(I) efflux system membrane fusion protein/cobalt-zinc-cadmium efflux system membrane fusion protein